MVQLRNVINLSYGKRNWNESSIGILYFKEDSSRIFQVVFFT